MSALIQHAGSGWRDGWYVVPYLVQFRDLDPFGHVNNAVFFTYFEWARTLLWFEIRGGRRARDISFIVARAECDFRAQITMEPIEIRTRISDMRSSSFDFVYEIWKNESDQIAAHGKVVVVLFDWEKQAKVAISDDLRAAVRMMQSEVAV